MKAAWFVLFAATVAAQTAGPDQTGGVTGVVTDAISHVPVKKATVSLSGPENRGRIPGSNSTVTDASGAFMFSNLQPGPYLLRFQHQNYPQPGLGGVSNRIEVRAGDVTGPVTVELLPSAVLSGHLVDEDGEPMQGCLVQPHSVKNPDQGMAIAGGRPSSNEDGEYRWYGLPPGKYILTAECSRPVFQPRPFSSGPDPPPSRAYPMQYYPMTTEAKSAEAVELLPGAEKAGIDFRMRPTAVTQVRGAFSPSGADWRGNTMMIQLVGLDRQGHFIFPGQPFDQAKGTFGFPQVFPGSYMLVASSIVGDIGATERIEVTDRPVAVTLELRRGLDLSGKVEIDNGGNASSAVTPNQLRIRLMPEREMGLRGGQASVSEDGSFTLRGVLPAPFRLQVDGPNCFLKSAWLGNTDVTNAPFDLTDGAAGALRIVVSTNTATVRGSAPAGQNVMAERAGEGPPDFRYSRSTQVNPGGQYVLSDLSPGKYRIALLDAPATSIPDGEGQEISVHEGETITLDLKPKPAQ